MQPQAQAIEIGDDDVVGAAQAAAEEEQPTLSGNLPSQGTRAAAKRKRYQQGNE
jgi:hypothetical protein